MNFCKLLHSFRSTPATTTITVTNAANSKLLTRCLRYLNVSSITVDERVGIRNSTVSPCNPCSLVSSRTYAFSSAEEAAAERRRRKRRLRIEPPLQALRRNPNPIPRDPNAPRLPDTTSALTGPRLNLHNRVQSLIRAFDLDAASLLTRNAVYSRTRPTVFTCNAIIAAMYRDKRYSDAVALFKFLFEQHDIVPNVVSYNNLINAHCDEGRVDVGIEVYRHIIATAPFSPSPVTYRHLTKGLIDSGRIEDAIDLLREMLNRGHGADSLVYNNLIKGFLETGNLEKANEFFEELKERCLVYDGIVNATFMDWWFKQGKEKEAMESYKSLMDKKFRMVPATCNVLLEVLLKHGKKEMAWALFEQMLDNHTPPNFQAVNSDTFNTMVNECFKEQKIEEAVNTFRRAGTRPGSKPFSIDVAGYNNIICRFCENGMVEDAENFFEEILSKSLSPDVTSFRTLIDAYLKIERTDAALSLFNRMVEAGLRVVQGFGTRVFREFIDRSHAVESANILTKMGEKDPKPDAAIYDVVVRGLCGAGSFDMAKEILDQMMRYGIGIPPTLKTFINEAFQNAGRGREIERFLDEKLWWSTSTPTHLPMESRAHTGPPLMPGVQQPQGLYPGIQKPQSYSYQMQTHDSFRHQDSSQLPPVASQTTGWQPQGSYETEGSASSVGERWQSQGSYETEGLASSMGERWKPQGSYETERLASSMGERWQPWHPPGPSSASTHQPSGSYQMEQNPSFSSPTGQHASWRSGAGHQQASPSNNGGQVGGIPNSDAHQSQQSQGMSTQEGPFVVPQNPLQSEQYQANAIPKWQGSANQGPWK